MNQTGFSSIGLFAVAVALAAVLLFQVGCGSADRPAEVSNGQAPTMAARATNTPARSTPMPTLAQPTPTQAASTLTPTSTPPTPTQAPPSQTPVARGTTPTAPPEEAEPTPASTTEVTGMPRTVGDYQGFTFNVTVGSQATFTVGEKLVRLPLPNNAVMQTMDLSGEVHLDGRMSVVEIGLHGLSSDQTYRDQYVREVMFPDTPTATFTVPNVGPIPEGLASGEEVKTRVGGSLEIGDVTIPLEFEIEARDDGDKMFIIGRTTFTWDQLGMPPPSSRGVASIDDEVRVEVLLRVFPEQG